jgi:four helix bundle protein
MSETKTTGNFKELTAWQKAMQVAALVYKIAGAFPSEEKFGLVSQMRRAAVSIPSNIAEGQARHTTGEFIQFISHAEGSVAELETQLLLSINLSFATNALAAPVLSLLDEVRRMLNALRRSLVTRH